MGDRGGKHRSAWLAILTDGQCGTPCAAFPVDHEAANREESDADGSQQSWPDLTMALPSGTKRHHR
jgi:hypothetical protein